VPALDLKLVFELSSSDLVSSLGVSLQVRLFVLSEVSLAVWLSALFLVLAVTPYEFEFDLYPIQQFDLLDVFAPTKEEKLLRFNYKFIKHLLTGI
jgi:hypothetical protein